MLGRRAFDVERRDLARLAGGLVVQDPHLAIRRAA